MNTGIVSQNPSPWPYAQNSVGRLRGILHQRLLGDIFCWDARGEARRLFESELKQAILDYLREHSDRAQESGSYLSIPLFMVGKRADRTKPVVMFVSDDKVARKEAFDLIVRSGIMTNYPGFELGQSGFEKFTAWAGETIFVSSSQREETSDCYQLTSYSSSDSDIRTAAAGGVVSYGGKHMLLTVSHFLKASPPTESPAHKAEAYHISDCEITGLGDFNYDDDEDTVTGFVETTRRGSVSDVDDCKESEIDDLDTPTSASESGEISERHSPISVQERFLEARLIGKGNTILCRDEFDYALVEVESVFSSAPIFNSTISLNDLDKIETGPRKTTVKAVTSAGSEVQGVLSEDTLTVRLPQSKEFVDVYTARFFGSLGPGDCGSWVRDEVTGRLFGHVFAGNIANGLTAIMPARLVFEHARALLDQQFALPPSLEANRGLGNISGDIESKDNEIVMLHNSLDEYISLTPAEDHVFLYGRWLSSVAQNTMPTATLSPSFNSLTDQQHILTTPLESDQELPEHKRLASHTTDGIHGNTYGSVQTKHPKIRLSQHLLPGVISEIVGPGDYKSVKQDKFVKNYICRDPATAGLHSELKLDYPLSQCEDCSSGKKYGAYYTAAAHLRWVHFRRRPNRGTSGSSVTRAISDKGRASRDWPSMLDIGAWLEEILVRVDEPPGSACADDATPDEDSLSADQVLQCDFKNFTQSQSFQPLTDPFFSSLSMDGIDSVASSSQSWNIWLPGFSLSPNSMSTETPNLSSNSPYQLYNVNSHEPPSQSWISADGEETIRRRREREERRVEKQHDGEEERRRRIRLRIAKASAEINRRDIALKEAKISTLIAPDTSSSFNSLQRVNNTDSVMPIFGTKLWDQSLNAPVTGSDSSYGGYLPPLTAPALISSGSSSNSITVMHIDDESPSTAPIIKSHQVVTSRLGRRSKLDLLRKTDRLFCTICNDYQDGFRGPHELDRHMRRHNDNKVLKKFICRDPASVGIKCDVQAINTLSMCEAWINHFYDPPTRERNTGGSGGRPLTEKLKDWYHEVRVGINGRILAEAGGTSADTEGGPLGMDCDYDNLDTIMNSDLPEASASIRTGDESSDIAWIICSNCSTQSGLFWQTSHTGKSLCINCKNFYYQDSTNKYQGSAKLMESTDTDTMDNQEKRGRLKSKMADYGVLGDVKKTVEHKDEDVDSDDASKPETSPFTKGDNS